MSKEAMKLALEALEFNCVMSDDGEDLTPMKIKKAITALREALAEQPTDWEAVAADQAMTIALLRTEQPAQRTWVGLTDEDVMSIVFNFDVSSLSLVAQAIEAKLKEKNT